MMRLVRLLAVVSGVVAGFVTGCASESACPPLLALPTITSYSVVDASDPQLIGTTLSVERPPTSSPGADRWLRFEPSPEYVEATGIEGPVEYVLY